ncbi:MAG TPA: DUF6691 family protein [Longimicrobiales bacterium]|nr:DUF6691 family protein [Longimicrobiales bacterium]
MIDLLPYFVLGIGLGLIFMKAELISWFRIQEMFRFQAFHMYGVLGSAAGVAALSVALLRRFGVSTFDGDPIRIDPKAMGKGTRYWAGGLIFGAGWAVTGACPGPFFALIGSGLGVFVIVLLCALAGMWTYGRVRPRLPH